MDQMKKALVSMVIESTLLKTGGNPLLDNVNSRLYKKFNSSVSGCYEHPEYLTLVLQEIFGEAHREMMKIIANEMTAFNYDSDIVEFIEKINY
jgi:hypothetical protein